VVPGRVTSGEVEKLSSAPTVKGCSLSINAQDGKVTVNKAQAVQTDIMASNGVIYVIDSVILPQ